MRATTGLRHLAIVVFDVNFVRTEYDRAESYYLEPAAAKVRRCIGGCLD